MNRRNKVVNIISNDCNNTIDKQHLSRQQRTLLIQAKIKKRLLHENKDVLDTKADNGNVTVIISRSKYLQAASLALADSNRNLEIENGLTSKIQNYLQNRAIKLSILHPEFYNKNIQNIISQ